MGTASVAWGKSLGFTLPCGINHTLLLMASWAFYLTNTSDIINFLCLLLSFLGMLKMCWFWPVTPKILQFWQATARHSVVCDLQRTASLYCTTCQTDTSVAVTWDGGNGPKNQAHHIAPFSHFLSQAIFFRKKHLTTTALCQPWLSLHCLASVLLCSISVLPFGRERSQAASARLTCRLLLCIGGCAELRVSYKTCHRGMQSNCLNWALWCTVFTQSQKSPRAWGNIAGEYH